MFRDRGDLPDVATVREIALADLDTLGWDAHATVSRTLFTRSTSGAVTLMAASSVAGLQERFVV